MLERLDNWGLYAKTLKYIFNTKQVEFLDYIITPIGVVIDLVGIDNLRVAGARELLGYLSVPRLC